MSRVAPWTLMLAGSLITVLGTALIGFGVLDLRRGQVFPLVELETLDDPEAFNAPPTTETIAPERLEVGMLAREVRRIMHHTDAGSLDAPPPRDSPPSSVPGVCSEYAKVAQTFAAEDGHVLRTVWMSTHTVNEYWDPTRERWIVVDKSGNLKWFDEEGEPLGVTDLVLAEPETITAQPIIPPAEFDNDPDLADGLNLTVEDLTHFTDSEVWVVIEDERLFEFHRRNRSPTVVLRYLLFGEPVARGVQFTPDGMEPPAGSVIWRLRIYLLGLGMVWVVGIGLILGGIRRAGRLGHTAVDT
ncbi:MAG: hypothetical protein JJU11_14025 [Candidatus Sumerlaeia bacterium]|nr:hypothetical protein [Candidatus Sumerlaeia bacterium]